jgi:hypothetical protein
VQALPVGGRSLLAEEHLRGLPQLLVAEQVDRDIRLPTPGTRGKGAAGEGAAGDGQQAVGDLAGEGAETACGAELT